MSASQSSAPVRAARNAVAVVFTANGFAYASWLARVPAVRDELALEPSQLGLVLLALSVGAVLALPTAGAIIARLGERRVVGGGALIAAGGVLGIGLARSPGPLVVALFALGLASGLWDVAMNVQAAEVERALRRAVMPRFHAGFSLGTVLGAATGAAAAAAGLGRAPHLALVAALTAGTAAPAVRRFLAPVADGEPPPGQAAGRSAAAAWREPRTLAIGVLVLGFALAEGVANDWLAVATVDSRSVENWVGAVVFGVFVAAMTAGRLAGPPLLERHGRVRVLLVGAAAVALGSSLVAQLGGLAAAVGGAVLWGLGASLGFPVGMSAAADDETQAPQRVSVVASIGYTAFLAGPPLVGFLADRIGTARALIVVVGAAVLGAAFAPAAASRRRSGRTI